MQSINTLHIKRRSAEKKLCAMPRWKKCQNSSRASKCQNSARHTIRPDLGPCPCRHARVRGYAYCNHLCPLWIPAKQVITPSSALLKKICPKVLHFIAGHGMIKLSKARRQSAASKPANCDSSLCCLCDHRASVILDNLIFLTHRAN